MMNDDELNMGMAFNVSNESRQPMLTEESTTWTKDLCGLRSQDPRTRTRARLGVCASYTVCCVVFLPLLFLVIIPAYVQALVNKSELIIIEANIINPSDVSFRSEVTQKFDNTGDIEFTADIKMRDLDLTWKDPSTGKTTHLVTLTDSNTITLESGKTVKLKSTAIVEDIEALTIFNVYVLGLDDFEWGVEGSADINGGTGDIRVDIDKKADMKGFNHFPTDVVINSIDITNGITDALISSISATITSPSNIGIDFQQNVNFVISSAGVNIGVGTIANMFLRTGVFDVVADVALTYTSDEEYNQLMQVISNFTMGLNSPVVMGPFATETPVAWLAPGLSLILLPTFIPGLDEQLIVQVDMYPPSADPEIIPFTMEMVNPIDTAIYLSYINADIYSSGIKIAYVDSAVDIVIPAHSTVTSSFINASVVLFDGSHSTFYVDITSFLTGAIDEFQVGFNYSQAQVITYLRAP